MTAGELAVWALLAAATAIAVTCSIGVAVMPGVYARLHFTGPAAVLSPALVAAAVVVREGINAASVTALLVAFILAATNPIVVHVTARMVRIHDEGGDWAVRPHELQAAEEP